jgi:hypothetical protein
MGIGLVPLVSNGQGCSDAGVCSIGALNITGFQYHYLPKVSHTLTKMNVAETELTTDSVVTVFNPADTVNKNNYNAEDNSTTPVSSVMQYPKYFFQVTTSYGHGDRGTHIFIQQLEANARIYKNKLYAQLKIPYSIISGKLASVNGMGDVTIGLSYFAFNKPNSGLSVTAGIKLPSNDANIKKNDVPLPIVYQTSLGSYDVLAGIKYTYRKWDITVGYQHSFNANGNRYLHLPLAIDEDGYNTYFESRNLRRADDAIFRLTRTFRIKRSLFSAGVLNIYHVKNDTYVNAADKRVEATGSDGLTLNITLSGIIRVSNKMDIIFVGAKPALTRKTRPDGLTRELVAILGIKYSVF